MQLIRHELRAVATTCPPSCSGISLPIHHGPRDAPFDHSLSPRQDKVIANGILCIILHTLFVLLQFCRGGYAIRSLDGTIILLFLLWYVMLLNNMRLFGYFLATRN